MSCVIRRVKSRPALRPLMVFDEECGFCRAWIRRWQRKMGGQIDYAPYQDVAGRFPEIPREAFRRSVHLIEPGGLVTRGAEAVAKSLAIGAGKRWILWAYSSIPCAATVAEWGYRWVVRNRDWLFRMGVRPRGGEKRTRNKEQETK